MGYRRGRPPKWKGYKITSLMLLDDYDEVYKKASELAEIEGITFAEIVAKALAEYVEKHYPGNPQIPLPTYTGQVPMAKTLEARITARQLKKDLELLKVIYSKRDNTLYRYEVESRVIKLVKKLAKLNTILKNKEYQDLINQAAELLGM